MKKEEIIISLRNLIGMQLTQSVLKIINDSLNDKDNYVLEQNGDIIKIHTVITETEHGLYFELSYEFDQETKNSAVIITKKEYNPTHELRYGFMQEVGLDMFTNSKSYVFSSDDLLLYSSWFSDDNRYYGNQKMPLDFSKKSLMSYFSDTTPSFKKGFLTNLPSSMYQPFTNIWERYGQTHVVKIHGRNPMNGEYSNIGITFDDNTHEDIKLLSESYGQIYVTGREINYNSEDEIVEKIEQIYQESNTENGFDFEGFHTSFNKSMFKSKSL